MIVHVCGTLTAKTPEMAVVEAAGVGYGVLVPLSTYERLPSPGQSVTLLTHLVTRENVGQELFGFLTTAEREVFTTVIGVSGVGPRLAVGILSQFSPDEFRSALISGDVKTLTSAPGVGKKTAERLVVELREVFGTTESWETLGQLGDAPQVTDPRTEAVQALVALGTAHHDAVRAVQSALSRSDGDDTSTETLIKAALAAT